MPMISKLPVTKPLASDVEGLKNDMSAVKSDHVVFHHFYSYPAWRRHRIWNAYHDDQPSSYRVNVLEDRANHAAHSLKTGAAFDNRQLGSTIVVRLFQHPMPNVTSQPSAAASS